MRKPPEDILPVSGNIADDYQVLPAHPPLERLGDGALRIWAPAKINLNLLVGPRGPDGFHPIDSIIAKVALYDQIDLRARDDGRIAFRCEGADCGSDEQNLALRAARLLAGLRRSGRAGADIVLSKHIHPGKGLGGGSSDAAAVLLGLNELWSLDLGKEELSELAAALGSDVPLFLAPSAARIGGRGEQVVPLEIHPFTAVLHVPDVSCATEAVYCAYDQQPTTMGRQLDTGLLKSRPPSSWRGLLRNQLAPAAGRVCGNLTELWDRLATAVPLPVCVTGSGSASFMLCNDDDEAISIVAGLPDDLRRRCLVARSLPAVQEWPRPLQRE